MVDVSVVIPSFNYGRFISEAIQSVLNQTIPAEEIIVVDDESTDDTAMIVSSFGKSVRYIKQTNAGVCAARNRGVAESSGEYIAFLDADDTWEPTKLEKQIELFSRDSAIGLVHCGMREFDSETGGAIVTHLEGQEGWVADELLLWERPVINGPGGTVMVSREAFDAVDGFDERIKVGEDWDFCYRVARQFKVGFVREPLVNYRSHSAAAHRNVRNMESGMRLFYQKAFSSGPNIEKKVKNRALANFHRILAGSYFHSGEYGQFVKHVLCSIWHRPAGISYFLEFPLRRLGANRTEGF